LSNERIVGSRQTPATGHARQALRCAGPKAHLSHRRAGALLAEHRSGADRARSRRGRRAARRVGLMPQLASLGAGALVSGVSPRAPALRGLPQRRARPRSRCSLADDVRSRAGARAARARGRRRESVEGRHRLTEWRATRVAAGTTHDDASPLGHALTASDSHPVSRRVPFATLSRESAKTTRVR
jgi:hypothetical protein